MRYFLPVILCFVPIAASASVKLADCDSKPYQVLINNGGSERTVTLTPNGGNIEEYGPVVSFQILEKGEPHPVMKATSEYEEFCIWHGQINVQRLNVPGTTGASF